MAAHSAMNSLSPTLVIGAGAWGTALAIALSRNDQPVWLWGRDDTCLQAIAVERVNQRYLPDMPLPENIQIKPDLADAVSNCHHVLIAVPSQAFTDTLLAIKPYLQAGVAVSWATKGLTPGNGVFLHETAQKILTDGVPLAVVSGPSFAAEVAAGLPTALTVASDDSDFADALAATLHSNCLRAYTTSDVLGVQIGGTVKNILAIAAGISDGLQYGANARAALLTRGMAEILRLAVALGAEPQTIYGLSGMGDLILTCTDDQSRNRQLGLAIGRGLQVDDAVISVGKTVEGMHAAREVLMRAQQANIEMPIVEQVCKVLFEGYDPRQSVQALLCRQPKAEIMVATAAGN